MLRIKVLISRADMSLCLCMFMVISLKQKHIRADIFHTNRRRLNIYIYIYTYVYLSLSLHIYIYIYIYTYMCIYVSLSLSLYIYIYIYGYLAKWVLSPPGKHTFRLRTSQTTGKKKTRHPLGYPFSRCRAKILWVNYPGGASLYLEGTPTIKALWNS